ncbi:MAG: hypothetical protein HYW78_01655 [Parcubacteria group bacterium]|nr:hypothetical protein [Parcubacteria group bacterium]
MMKYFTNLKKEWTTSVELKEKTKRLEKFIEHIRFVLETNKKNKVDNEALRMSEKQLRDAEHEVALIKKNIRARRLNALLGR